MMVSKFLKARQPLFRIPEHKEYCVGSYMTSYVQRTSPNLLFQSRLDWDTTFLSKLKNILLNAFAKSFLQVCYALITCTRRT